MIKKLFSIICFAFALLFLMIFIIQLTEPVFENGGVAGILALILICGSFVLWKPSRKSIAKKRKKDILTQTSLTEETLAKLEEGIMPIAYTKKLILRPREICHYYTLATRLITKNEIVAYQGDSAGVSLGVAKGINLMVGKSRGVPIRANITEESTGELFITSERVIFLSRKDNFETPLNKISAKEIYSNGIGMQDDRKYYLMKLVAPSIPYTIIEILIERGKAS